MSTETTPIRYFFHRDKIPRDDSKKIELMRLNFFASKGVLDAVSFGRHADDKVILRRLTLANK
ncbi:hypothetical protein E4U16_005214 [Claviceps sp. LM84 group G4]|nr:hypothetical protein E4U16_005214 [Claviceps sp. LM84 group G4]